MGTAPAGLPRLFHFTSTRHLPLILQTGALLPTESNVHPTIEHAGPDVVWLTDTEDASLGHGLRGSQVDKTAVRFEVAVPAIPWLDWSHAAAMPPVWRETFLRAGGGLEAAGHWYVFPAAIRMPRWRGLLVEGREVPL